MSDPRIVPVLHGLPDDMTGAVFLNEQGQLQLSLPGTAVFLKRLSAEQQARMPRVYVQADKSLQLPASAKGKPVINYVADPDRCSNSLLQIMRVVQLLEAPCFNSPSAVARTGRHAIAKALAGVPGLLVPRTELIEAKGSTDLVRQIDAAQLRYPLLLRSPGMHVGATMSRVDSPEEVEAAVYDMPMLGRGTYVTEFHDYRDPDGCHRKMRLVVVGRQVFLRHFIVASDWHVHVHDRIRQDDPEEARILRGFPASLPMDAAAIALQIADIIGLDYFGIDCSPRPDGQLLLFEANAAMDILRRQDSATDQAWWDERIDAIRDALIALLDAPEKWRQQGKAH